MLSKRLGKGFADRNLGSASTRGNRTARAPCCDWRIGLGLTLLSVVSVFLVYHFLLESVRVRMTAQLAHHADRVSPWLDNLTDLAQDHAHAIRTRVRDGAVNLQRSYDDLTQEPLDDLSDGISDRLDLANELISAIWSYSGKEQADRELSGT